MQQLAIGLIVEVGALRTAAENPLHLRLSGELGITIVGVALVLRNYLQAPAIQIESRFGTHEFEHGAVARIHESRFEIDLRVWVFQKRLRGIGGLPSLLSKFVAD